MEEFFDRLNLFHKKYLRYFLMLFLIAAVVLFFKVLPYLTVLLLPFIIGWIVSLVASPLVKFLKNKLKVPYMVGAIITVLLLLTLLALIVVTAVSLVSEASVYVINNWEGIVSGLSDYFASAYNGLIEWSDSLPFDFMEMINMGPRALPSGRSGADGVSDSITKWGTETISSITRLLRPFAGNVATGTISIVKTLPEAIIFIVMLMLSTFFFTSRRGVYSEWYQKNAPENFRAKMHLVKTECFDALVGTIRAQLILTAITAVELFVGFLLLGIEDALLLALIIAIVDMLPILGVGTVLIPWGIINLLAGGGVYVSIGLIMLYIICLCVRNIVQPKVLGNAIGIDAVASLISIWVGYKLYGFIGMLIMPVIATVLYKLYDIGMFDWFFLSHKKVTEEKFGLVEENAKEEGN